MEENQIQIDELLTDYLYHNLSEPEEAAFQDKMLKSDDLFERLEVVEMKLIDSFVCGRMTANEKDRFEKQFLIFPQNREKVKEAQIFHQALTSCRQNDKPSPPSVAITGAASGSFISNSRFLVALTVLVITGAFGFLATRWNQRIVPALSSSNNTNRAPDRVHDVALPPVQQPEATPSPAKIVTAKSDPPHSHAKSKPSVLKVHLAASILNNLGTKTIVINNSMNSETIRFILPLGKPTDKYIATITRESSSDLPVVVNQEFKIMKGSRYLDVRADQFKEKSIYALELTNLNRTLRLDIRRNSQAAN